MSTTVMSKKRFLLYLEGQIEDTDVVLVTVDKSGSVTYNKKRHAKSVQFDFAASCFKNPDDIRDLLFIVPSCAIAICPQNEVSEETKELLKKGDELYLSKKAKKKVTN